MFNHTDIYRLIGREVEISIGEPWDFCSSAGENRLEGKITGFLPYKDDYAILLDVSEFDFKGRKISSLAGTARTKKIRCYATDLPAGKDVMTNFHIFSGAFPSDFSYLDTSEGCLITGLIGGLIGGLTLKD